MQLPVLPQGNIDAFTTSSQPPTPQRCVLESITGALSDTQLAVASMHKQVEDLERNLHSCPQELNAVKAEFAEFKMSVEKQLADSIHSVMTGRIPADAPGQHSGLACEPRMCRLPAYVDGLRSGPSYVFARLESIINPSSCPDYSNYGVQNPAASGWSELSHNEHARQTAQETKKRLSRMMPDYIQRKDALTNQQKERSAQMQMRMEVEKEERREAFWKKRVDERLREAIHAEQIKKWEQRKEDRTSALRERMSDKEDKIKNESWKKQRQGRDLVEGALKEYRDEIEEVRRKAGSLRATMMVQGENAEEKRSDL